MGRNTRFARTASEEDLAQADAALMFYDSEDMASQPATATTTTTSATTTTAAATAGTSSSSTRQGRKAALTISLAGSNLCTAATTTITTTTTTTDSATTTGAVSATVALSGPTKRAPRATPTHTPPELPATAREVTDVASLARVVTLLSATIERAVHDGKSVTAVNKRLISCAAEEIRRAAHALTRASPAEPQRTTDQPTTLTDATGLGGFKEELVACVRAEITKLKAELGGARPGRPPPEATTAAASTSRSYAHALGSRPARRPAATHTAATPPALRVSKPAIIITAKKEAKTRQDAVTAFRKSISFKECKFAPIQVKPVSGNKLRVEFETSGQRDDTLQRLQGSEQVSAELARSLQPLIIVKGIDRDTPAEELVEIIRGQNPALNMSNDDLRLKFKRTNRNPKLYNAVFTTRPALFRVITELGRVCIDHQRVHVEEFSPFIQCFCCLQFGHVRKNCPTQEEVCAFCAGFKHTEATCPARKLDGAVARCLNCANRNSKFDSKTDTRHNATSYSCSVLRAMKLRVESRVDYGSVQ